MTQHAIRGALLWLAYAWALPYLLTLRAAQPDLQWLPPTDHEIWHYAGLFLFGFAILSAALFFLKLGIYIYREIID